MVALTWYCWRTIGWQRWRQHGNAINEEFGANKVKTCVVRMIYGICIFQACACECVQAVQRNSRKQGAEIYIKKVGNQVYTKYERVLFFLFWFRTSTNWKKTVERFFITAGLAVALVSFIVNKIN